LAKNIEIKALLHEPASVEDKIIIFTGNKLNDILHQVDTFYRSPFGRIKIREINNAAAELIFYNRANFAKARESKYYKFNLFFPNLFKAVLKFTLGVRGQVEKERRLYFYDNTRIHLDSVKGLGAFIEFEYVVDDSHPEEKGSDVINTLMMAIGINEKDLLSVSYIDLLTNG
jgi:predicted adenylyl cyclase CyaB